MKFIDAVEAIIKKSGTPLSPSEIRNQLKVDFPHFYNTESHQGLVDRGSCQSLDHALLLQIYNLAKNPRFICDRTTKPIKLSINDYETSPNEDCTDLISSDAIENNIGSVYILKTGTFTKEGKEIVKIGITSGDIEQRISQLFNTSVPYRFSVYSIYKIEGFIEVERALHSLFNKYRLNTSREFFTEDVIKFVDQVISLYYEIND